MSIQAERDLSKLVKRDEVERTAARAPSWWAAPASSVVGDDDTLLVASASPSPWPRRVTSRCCRRARPRSRRCQRSEMAPDRITHDRQATVVVDGSTIILKADGDIRIRAGGEVQITGGLFVKINCSGG